MEELLKKILAAQLAQLSLLQSIAANIAAQTRADVEGHDKTAQWNGAVKAVQTALTHLP